MTTSRRVTRPSASRSAIKHVGGAIEGAECTATARLREVIDGRKLRFDVEVKEGARTIGIGTHERRMISVAPEV